jgi:hypothetical protein
MISDPKMSLSTKQKLVEQAYLSVLARLTPRQQRQFLRGGAATPKR